jgi:A/G-specific adenine glycosylase
MPEVGWPSAVPVVDRESIEFDSAELARERNPREFADELIAWFERFGRSTLPWRTNREPYRVAVSEFMLQQTQVERVVPIFEAFVARWPSFGALAAASQADVVRAWKGLGYNSRAVRLHRLARVTVERYGGKLPSGEAPLRELPGVGPYTARAIAAFAFNAGVVAFDTNVRRIVHRTQLGLEWPPLANDSELEAIAARLIPADAGYRFNSALMDLGATLCTARAPKCLLCPLQTTCVAAPIDPSRLALLARRHAKARSPQERLRFEATTRYVRGRIIDRLRALSSHERISLIDLYDELAAGLEHHDAAAVEHVALALERDGVIERGEDGIRLSQ